MRARSTGTGCGRHRLDWGTGSDSEGAGVALKVALQAGADGFAEVEDGGFGDGIDDVGAIATASDDAGIGEGLEVAGGVGLGEFGGLDELGDIEFAVAEGLEDAESGRFTEDPEPGGDEFDGLGREG